MRAEELLRKAREGLRTVEAINARREYYMDLATRITRVPTKTPGGRRRRADKIGECAVALADLERELAASLKEALAIVSSAEKVLDRVTPRRREAAAAYFLTTLSHSEVAEKLDVQERTIYKLLAAALDELQDVHVDDA